MSVPLGRLPFLATREIIKSMRTREIFILSVLSKKSANLVMLSIPKGSLSAEFALKTDELLFKLNPDSPFDCAPTVLRDGLYRVQGEDLVTMVSTNNLYVRSNFYSLSGTSEAEESIRKLFYYFSKTFKNLKIYIRFEDETREGFAMEILKFAWESGIPLDSIDFFLKNASSETIQELSNGCQDHTFLYIGTKFPEGFQYTPPPGGYKFKSLAVKYAHWVNLDDFLQCRKVSFKTELPNLTVDYLNGLLKKIANLECKLESFEFKLESIEPIDFPEIVKGLSKSAIKRKGPWWQGLEFERKDGLKLLVSLVNGYLDLD